jgi:predicted permease
MNLLRKLHALFRKRKLDAEMSEEMRLHLEQRVEENLAAGMSPDDARYAALRRFGGVERFKQLAREQRGALWLEQTGQDLRHAARSLRQSPGFTGIAVLTLALGIGVNTAAFSLLNALLLHRLPYPRPAEIVRFEGTHTPANFLDYRAQNTAFAQLAAFRQTSLNFAAPGAPADRLAGMRVSADFFPLLGIAPALGRTFTADEERSRHDDVVVLSHATWVDRFASDAAIVGRSIRLDGVLVTVIGVMPPEFDDFKLWGDIAAWRPLALSARAWADRDNAFLSVLARRKTGVSDAQAQSALESIAARLAADYPQFNGDLRLGFTALGRTIQDDMGRRLTWLVLGLSGFVLLIACANLANLQFARHTARAREHAVRTALGASRAQLMRRVLVESCLLSLVGGAAGCLVARWANDLVGARFTLRDHVGLELPLDLRVLGFAFVASVVAGVGFGLLPAWLASRAKVGDALKQGGRSFAGGRTPQRLRRGLIVGEVALALVLLSGAGFFLRGLERFTARDPGWQTGGLLTAQVSLRGHSSVQNAAFFAQLEARLTALPGVERVAIASSLPTSDYSADNTFAVEGRPEPARGNVPTAAAANVSPDFFATLGIRVLKGRAFTSADRLETPEVVIVNESMARALWPGENPLGKRIGSATPHLSNLREVVGVVSDVRPIAVLRETEGRFQMYRPLAQRPWDDATIALRTRGAPEMLVPKLRQVVAALDPDTAVFNVNTPRQIVQRSLAATDAAAWTLAAFAALGVLLAAVGIYGVIAGFVAQRTAEIGLRMALGAQVRDVLRLVLGQGLSLALLGTAVGLAGAFAIARLLAKIIPALPAAEPATAAAVVLLLIGVAVLACWLPARRATKVDPMTALRAE